MNGEVLLHRADMGRDESGTKILRKLDTQGLAQN